MSENAEVSGAGQSPYEIRTEFRNVSPSGAAKLLRENHFAGQRPLSEARVARYLALIAGGNWRLGTLDFHHVRAGGEQHPPYLTNGQHRLTSVSRQESPLPFLFVHHYVPSEEDVRLDYESYDPPGSSRSLRDVMSVTGLEEAMGMGRTNILRISSAVRLAEHSFNAPRPLSQITQRLLTNQGMTETLLSWAEPARAVMDSLASDATLMRPILMQAAPLAVWLVTVRYQAERADKFWKRVVKGVNLADSDPEHRLRDALLRPIYPGKGDSPYVSRLCAAAWNAAFEGRSLRYLVGPDRSMPIKLLGTPFSGRDERKAHAGNILSTG